MTAVWRALSSEFVGIFDLERHCVVVSRHLAGPYGRVSELAVRHVHELTGLVLDSSRGNLQRLDTSGGGGHAVRHDAERGAGRVEAW